MKVYIDSSAVTKLLIGEAETNSLVDWLEAHATADLLSSMLVVTELHRAAVRAGASHQAADEVLDGINVVELSRGVARLAGVVGSSGLRSLDAIHLATALSEDADVFVAYDRQLQQAATEAGLRVEAPG